MPRNRVTHPTKAADSITLSNGRRFKSLPGRNHVLTEGEAWLIAVENGIILLTKLHAAHTIHGRKWLTKMREHYGTKIRELLADAPDECLHLVPGFEDRINKL